MRWWAVLLLVAGAAGAVGLLAIVVKRRATPLKSGEREEPIRDTERASLAAARRPPLFFMPSGAKDTDPTPWWEGGEGN